MDQDSQGGWLPPPSTLPLVYFQNQDGWSDLKNFFMERCPKDEATATNFKSSSHLQEKFEKPVLGGGPPRWPSEG